MITAKADKERARLRKKREGFNTEVYDSIMRFLRSHHRESKNTSRAYERDIRLFFKTKKGKDIEHLTASDLTYSLGEFDDYQSYLIDDLKLSYSTASRHITSISECMRYLHKAELISDIGFIEIKRPKAEPNSYDGFTREEIEKISDYVATTGRRKTGKIKRVLIRFSFDTCMRLEECLNLAWSNFIESENSEIINVRTVAKGKKIMNREIKREVYEELLTIKEEGKDKVFNIGTATVSRMMNDIRDYLNIDPNQRHITFHSIRKAGAQWIWEEYRDINQVSKALGHESIQTTELYINKNENYGVMGALSSEFSVDSQLFKNVSHETLLQAIELLSKERQLSINLKLSELIER